MNRTIELPVVSEVKCDVVVAGGGPAGFAAALSAARHGMNVVLMDEGGMLGGLSSVGLVAPISAVSDRSGRDFGGIGRELINNISKQSSTSEEPEAGYNKPAMVGLVMLDMLVKAGVHVHFHTKLVTAEREERRITGVIAAAKSGLRRFTAQQFIDCTGDGDLFVSAGEEFVFGSEIGVYDQLFDLGLARVHNTTEQLTVPDPGSVQPSSVMFTVGGVVDKNGWSLCNRRFTYRDFGITKEEFQKLPYAGQVGFEEDGENLPLPQGRFLFFKGARPGEYTINMSRVIGVNGADADSLNKGTIDAELQILPILDMLRRFMPGFENAYLIQTSMRLGVRESRRLVGRKVLAGADVVKCTPMNDVIAHGSYGIDIHDPRGKSMALGGPLRLSAYDIPYESLLPKEAGNLFVAGRCISADHVAHASTRIIGTCMQTGQAAGTAAAMCIRSGLQDSGELDVRLLQRELMADGVFLHIPGINDRSTDIVDQSAIC
ncbi:MAG: FAD-dependent oxidoreductase [Clostridia bacterium]|nr:FAD-dependent oxidoreductase [Clostridia bacterium]